MSLREWYGQQEVLLTGVTSELGQNLLEKLLRSFPDIKVHLVLRSRCGFNYADRVKKKIFTSPGYERLLQERPDAISRVESYEGNLVYEDLGMRIQDQRAMANVSVVFHAAGPSKDLLQYCRELPNLRAVVVAGDLFRWKDDQILESWPDDDEPKDLPVGLIKMPALGPAYRDPMPGYVQLLRSASAMMVGAGYVRGRGDLPAEIIPMDIASNTLIAAAWDVHRRGKAEGPVVYNASTICCSWSELILKGDRANRTFRYPTFRVRGITTSAVLHWFIVFLFEWLPSYICDTVLSICRQKPRIVAEHERIRKLLKSFEPITLRAMTVERRKVKDMQKQLTTEDQESFPLRAEIDIEAYILCAAAATRKYCVDENNLRIVRLFLPTIFALLFLGFGYYYFSH